MNWLKRLFKRKDDEVYFVDGPAYKPGDLVIVYDPYVLDGMDAHEVSKPRFETVKQSAYAPNLGVYAYQFVGDSVWYNEDWLFPAVYGTEQLNIVIAKEPSKKAQVDALLDEYRDYKALSGTFGDAEYSEKLAEIEEKIKNV
jgi:hypothetical protein